MKRNVSIKKAVLLVSASGLALMVAVGAVSQIAPGTWADSAAYAQETDGHDDGHESGGGSGHGQGGQGGGGHDDGATGESDEGEVDPDKKGPYYGKPAEGEHGGQPVWAGEEAIPEVELGRLNVARSPEHVIAQAYAEALKLLDPESELYDPSVAAFYSLPLGDITLAEPVPGTILYELTNNFDNISFIDAPLQNLAFFQDALDGSISLPGVTNSNDVLLAVFLGSASDKNVPITVDTVIAVTTILGDPITGAEAQALADAAEAVREAILEGHG